MMQPVTEIIHAGTKKLGHLSAVNNEPVIYAYDQLTDFVRWEHQQLFRG